MKTKKLSLSSIKNVLSRAEMKTIMAGSGGCRALNPNESCSDGSKCVDANGYCSNCCVA